MKGQGTFLLEDNKLECGQENIFRRDVGVEENVYGLKKRTRVKAKRASPIVSQKVSRGQEGLVKGRVFQGIVKTFSKAASREILL